MYLWRRLIALEKANRMGLSSEEVNARVAFLYWQFINCFSHFPDTW